MNVDKTERKLMDRIGKEEMHKIFSFPCCEIDPSFLGFMEKKTLRKRYRRILP